MAKSSTTFKTGNKAAVGADHGARKMMTQQLVSTLNEQFQGMKWDKAKKAWVKDGKPTGITNLRKILDNLVFNATVLKDQQAINAIFDRVEGKPVQGISGPEGEPLEATTFIVRFTEPKKAGTATPAHHALAKDTTPGAAGKAGGAGGA